MCVVWFEWYQEVLSGCLDFLKFYYIMCFQLNIPLCRDPLHARVSLSPWHGLVY